MPLDAPFQLGPFSVDGEGRLSLASAEALPRVSIEWRGCRVEAALAAGAAREQGELSLCATVGRVPSTAADAAGQRAALFAALRGLPATLPAGWPVAARRTRLMPTAIDRSFIGRSLGRLV